MADKIHFTLREMQPADSDQVAKNKLRVVECAAH